MSDNDGFDGPDGTDEFFKELLETHSHRQARPLRYDPGFRDRIYEIVEKLLDLELQNHPGNNHPITASPDKELNSIEALMLIGKLVDWLGGWAIDHRAGMILNEAAVFPWPEDDEEAPALANSHVHEATGSAHFKYSNQHNSKINQRILSEITSRAPVVPMSLRGELSEAFAALAMGEIFPLLKPEAKRGRKNVKAYSLWRLRLRAVEHANFFHGVMGKKAAAYDFVGDKYAVDASTIEGWEHSRGSLKKYFGESFVQNARRTAQKGGARTAQIKMMLHPSENELEMAEFLLLVYGEEKCVEHGKKFRKINKEASSSSSQDGDNIIKL